MFISANVARLSKSILSRPKTITEKYVTFSLHRGFSSLFADINVHIVIIL